ncbi:MAG: hypothetical protein LUI06_03965 [Ruminococcus sp.]|nr:hypothetical protein [Ruminococcus sp.]
MTAIAALFIIELLTVVLINGLNLYFTTAQVDETIELIIENNGSLPEKRICRTMDSMRTVKSLEL